MKVGKYKKIITCLLAVVMLGSLVYSTDVTRAEGTINEPIDNKNISLTKTAEWDDTNQQAKIRMEAYTTGKVTTSTVPSDIVLVLDVSGSMKETIETKNVYEKYTGSMDSLFWYDDYYKEIFVKIGEEYIPVIVSRKNVGEWWNPDYRYTMTYTYNGETVTICKDVENQRVSNFGKYEFYEESKQTVSKMDALKEAVNKFIDDAKTKNDSIAEQDKKHRIAIVKFSDSSSARALCNLTTVDGNTVERLKGYVSSLSANGGTHPEAGLDIANNKFDYSSNRNKVTIMFTDGGPGGTTLDPFDSSVAIDTIDSSKTLKDKGVKVYSVGVFKDADPTDTTKEFNGYMHGVSSNYPNATGYIEGNGYRRLNNRVEGNYYLAATNSDELLKIFEDISEDIDSGTTLDINSYVSDVISDNFILPNAADSVIAYKETVTGKDSNGNYTFDESREYIDEKYITYDSRTREVKVSGFDYKSDFIREQNGKLTGKRLVIEITVKPKDGFIGGNQILTNDEASVKDSTGTKHEEEDVNTIDIPLLYDFDNKDAAIYVGSDWNKIERFLNINEDENGKHIITYKNTRNDDRRLTNYTIDGLNNEYVNIIYTVKTKDSEGNEKIVGTYTIDAGQTTGTWDPTIDINSELKRDCENYYVSVEVSPANKKTESNNSDIYAETIASVKDNPSVLHIIRPTLDLNDDQIFLGNNSQLDERITVENTWSDIKGHDINNLNIEGTKKLTYEYKQESGPKDIDDVANVYTPDKTGTGVFTVTVKNNGQDITDVTTFHSESYGNQNKFKVDVVGGTISLDKELINLTNKPVDPNDGDPIFIFRIDRLENGNVTDTYYRYVKMEEKDGSYVPVQDIPDLVGLKKGTYRITEESSLRFKPTDYSTVDYYDGAKQLFGGSTIEVKIDEEDTKVLVTYANEVKSDDYDSDNGILVNKFELIDGEIKVNPVK